MKSDGILADTCAWIEYFRPGSSPMKTVLENLLVTEKIFTCGTILYEISRGIKSGREKKAVMEAMNSLYYAEMTGDLWIKAGELAAPLRSAGKTLPMSDILIATLAMKHNLSLLTMDAHFKEFEGLTLYDCVEVKPVTGSH